MSGRRFEEAGFNGLEQVWDDRVQENDADVEWQGSAGWSRCGVAGFNGLAQV